ncbi:hypothetical protein J1N35_025195 [Gossypium stocksii]|uniref:Uncharacterized protein n=1 Tax=Gossypium stocksii TaxID=47602 RepID=A0A9D3V5U7_9ROSI|nr:hypothetical protein J1N35_025195 [Gossypium stocksii]
MESIRRQCGFLNGIDVEAVDMRGGLSLGWKKGERIREERQMATFNEALEYCEIYNLGFFEQWYSCKRGRLVDNNIREILDRGVANTEWWNLFPRHEEEFRPQRRPRQGDLLSPYLFFICTEVDSVLFGEASGEGVYNMKCVIQEYKKISDQLVNFDKLLIYLSGNVDLETQEQMGRFLGVRISNNPERYLGLPTMGARQLFEEGMGWQIGNGDLVNILNNSWLPGPGNGRIKCQNMDIRFIQVSDLIDKETNTWKQDIIRSLFGEEQLKCILTIPLASSRPRDALMWRGDNTGYIQKRATTDGLLQRGY